MSMGLEVLYPSSDAGNAEVINADIVAVHGLYGDRTSTWTSRQTNAFWLKDFLPRDVPNARVMTFGYNADAAFGNTTAGILDYAKSLLSSLIDKREGIDEPRRPIIFIGHSLGGIVIKQSLFQARIEQRYENISESTAGIVFLGTPHRGHRGGEKEAYGKVLANLATAVLNTPPPHLLHALQVNSEALMRLTTDFRFQVPKYQICSFYEMRPMAMLSTLVVEKHSALLEIDGEDQIPVDANHEEMCKFRGREDDVYEKLFMRIRRMIKSQDCVHLNSSHVCRVLSYNKHYSVPHNLSAIFTGREDIIQKISKGCLPSDTERLIKQKRFVLYGLGGSGKTQICAKFTQDYRERFWGIFWINASSHITAQQGFLEISRVCGIDEKHPEAIRQWLSNAQDHWLLIIDNADDPHIDVSEFFPKGNRGSILLTTRNPHCKIHSTVGLCELGQMNMSEAVTLLLKATGSENAADEVVRKKATSVAQTLGFLALAIVQAGAYIRQGYCSIEEYCDVYTRRRQILLKHFPVQASSDYKYSVYTTWEISIEAIEKMDGKTSQNAIELIRIFCFLHYEGITEDIFEQAWRNSYENGDLPQDISHMFYMHPQEDWDPMMIREAVVLLASFSLIKINETRRCISMHPLVHVWARDRLSEELQKCSWVKTSFTLGATNSWKNQLTDIRFRRSLLLHIESCISLCRDKPFLTRNSGLDRVDIASGFAMTFAENGRLQEAVKLREKVLKARQKMLESEHPDTLRAMANLANSYSRLGRWQEAMELHEQASEGFQRTLGREHPDTLRVMTNLGNSYSNLGRWQEAMELHEQASEGFQRTLGREHPDTLNVMTNLANSYSNLGRRQDAVELQEKTLEAKQRTLGSEHPGTLSAMRNLSISYNNLGRGQEAAELGEKVLEASQRTLGSEHPNTLRAMYNLAISYKNLGRGQEATELGEKVLEASQRTLGSEHPDTLSAMRNLSISYGNLGRGQEATELGEKVLEASQRTLGSEHPDTLRAMTNLAISCSNLGRRQEAMELNEKVVEARQRTLGSEHPDTLSAMRNLSMSYSNLGRGQEATELGEKVLEASQRTLGSEHLDTLRTMIRLAISYSNLGRGQKAMELNEKVVEARQRTLGSEHPDTLSAMRNLSMSYSNLGRGQEATELGEKVLEASQRTLGSEHLDTLRTMIRLAISYKNLGRGQEATELGEKVLEASQRTLGSEHPDTLMAIRNLAISYSDLGRWQEATELGEKVLEASQRTLGSEHPDTLSAMRNLSISYGNLGRGQEAAELGEKVLEASQRTLGSEHQNTLRTMYNLAISYKNLGRGQEATELGEKVLEASQRTLGSEHPDTLMAIRNLAISYSDLGRWQEATELGEKVLEASQRTLGSEHPDTLSAMRNLSISYSNLGRGQEATELGEKVLEASQRILGSEHPDTLRAMNNITNLTREKVEIGNESRESSPFDRHSQSKNSERRDKFRRWLNRISKKDQ